MKQHKKSSVKPVNFVKRTHFRKAPAKVRLEKDGAQILCPFCAQPHEIGVVPAPCGTKILVYAVQEIYNGVKCALCGSSEGDKIKIGTIYRCAVPCRNDMEIFTTPPKKSLTAALAWRLPKSWHERIGRKFGRVPMILSRGNKVTGYAWRTVEMKKDAQKEALSK